MGQGAEDERPRGGRGVRRSRVHRNLIPRHAGGDFVAGVAIRAERGAYVAGRPARVAPDAVGRQTPVLQAAQQLVAEKIPADRGDDAGAPAELVQVIGDVEGSAAGVKPIDMTPIQSCPGATSLVMRD